jgi:hypothetical protein
MDDLSYELVFKPVVKSVIDYYQPTAIVLQGSIFTKLHLGRQVFGQISILE